MSRLATVPEEEAAPAADAARPPQEHGRADMGPATDPADTRVPWLAACDRYVRRVETACEDPAVQRSLRACLSMPAGILPASARALLHSRGLTPHDVTGPELHAHHTVASLLAALPRKAAAPSGAGSDAALAHRHPAPGAPPGPRSA
ncbi:hypothetical protein, partial [Streptomyces zhihengii]|uniref:hypothetical protein n=1 Tax=Streptomyces zhihengii TaxID=1818004 RepID=UPI0033B02BBD